MKADELHIEVMAVEPQEYSVRVRQHDLDKQYFVRVSPQALVVFGQGRAPERLLEETFRFLLERWQPGDIDRAFVLQEVPRFFPEYEQEMVRRLASP